MKLGIPEWLKKVFGGAPAVPAAPAPDHALSNANDIMAARLARINAAETQITAAQAKIDELTLKLVEAKQKETGAAQALLAKARTGEDTRQYTEAQRRARDEVVSLSNSLLSAQRDLATAKDEQAKV